MAIRSLTLDALRIGLKDGTASVRGVVSEVLNQVRASTAPVWLSQVPAAQLLAQADALDARIRAEGAAAFEALPLLGVPFAVKDNIDLAGLPTTAGCPGFADGPAATNAAVVQRLIAAGAIAIGKTNLDQFATGLVGTRSPHGAVPNPFSAAHVSGGSSSGSAYAVSAGLVAFALGTDTAGSGRVPAGF